ncbi:MAG: hypothetical protein Q4D37_10195, partial [Oscillospiraceae bacterium]|nr:hypothetical protein [Oscillospiraceae bacterium]
VFIWRTANVFSSRLQFSLIATFVKGNSLFPYLEDALPFCRLRRHSCPTFLSALLTFSHAVGNHPHYGESPFPPS